MTDIELVINIPKSYYELVLERCKDPVLLNAFKNGTPLPKGRGRLIDADVLVDGMEDNYEFCEAVNATPTIIASGKAEGSEKE